MSDWLSKEPLLRTLEGRFQIPLLLRKEVVDGCSFNALRCAELEYGNGFAILLSRTHKQFEASFRADNFAGALLRDMSEADDARKQDFLKHRDAAERSGLGVYVAINGNDLPGCLETTERWTRLEIDVSAKISLSNTVEKIDSSVVQATSVCLALVLSLLSLLDEASLMQTSVKGLPEGAKLLVEVNRYERSPANRAACIDHYGHSCQCCGFDFAGAYGDVGAGYIEVHHRTPVSQIGTNYIVDPVKDLVPLCGNCHAMVHRMDPPLDVEALSRLVRSRQLTLGEGRKV